MQARTVAASIVIITASAITSAPTGTAVAAPGGDHPTGSPGIYNPRDQLGTHKGVTCHYRADGALQAISVVTPKVEPLRIYSKTHRQSIVKWQAQLQRRIGRSWHPVGGWHRASEKLLSAKAVPQTLKALGLVRVTGAKVNGSYRVRERIQWKDYNSFTAIKGSVVHVMAAYYYGPHTAVATSCHDRRPTAASTSTSVLAGKTLTVDLLTHAKDADHDVMRLKVLSATKNGSPTSVGAQPNGSITISTQPADAGKSVVVRWVAVDPAGVRSAPAALTVAIRDQAPGAPSGVMVSAVEVTDHNGGEAAHVQANVAWTAPTSGTPACYDIRAVRMVSVTGAAGSFSADPSATQTFTCHSGTGATLTGLVPDNEGDPNYVRWEVRGVSYTNKPGPWTTTATSQVPNEIGHPGPDAFQELRYSGYWIQSLTSATPTDCNTQKDTVKTQDVTTGMHPDGTEVQIQEYDETGC